MNGDAHAKFKVAVCGAGIAGLALASFLSKSEDITVDVFEVKPEIRTIGAGIAIWKRYWDILHDLHGFEEQCAARGVTTPEWSLVHGPVLRKSDIRSGGFDFYSLSLGPKVLPRTLLLDILKSKLHSSNCKVYTSKCLSSYRFSEQGPVVLRFEDGTTSTADLLVGADGVHSNVRKTLFKDQPRYAEPQFSGQFAYRMRCLQEDLRKINEQHLALSGFKIWCGSGRHVTSNAVGEYIQITTYDNVPCDGEGPLSDPWVLDVSAGEVADSYQDWEPDLTSLLRSIDTASRWAIHVVQPLPYCVCGPVALIGDSAHAMTPHQGLGGGQGIEDAYILWRLLAHPTTSRSNLAKVLQIYNDIRLPFAQKVAARSLANGLMYGFLLPEYDGLSLDIVGRDLGASCEWLVEDKGCEAEWLRAEAMLRELKT
ncbi:hypothetical protein MMC30_005964 [Trapelia coarctata]|nr:hypothetical protein [Trapelia coarctata]